MKRGIVFIALKTKLTIQANDIEPDGERIMLREGGEPTGKMKNRK